MTTLSIAIDYFRSGTRSIPGLDVWNSFENISCFCQGGELMHFVTTMATLVFLGPEPENSIIGGQERYIAYSIPSVERHTFRAMFQSRPSCGDKELLPSLRQARRTWCSAFRSWASTPAFQVFGAVVKKGDGLRRSRAASARVELHSPSAERRTDHALRRPNSTANGSPT